MAATLQNIFRYPITEEIFRRNVRMSLWKRLYGDCQYCEVAHPKTHPCAPPSALEYRDKTVTSSSETTAKPPFDCRPGAVNVFGETAPKEVQSMTKDKSIRQKILETALNLTTGDRNKSYGDPVHNLTVYVNLVEAYLCGRGDGNEIALNSVDGAVLMALAKISRIAVNQKHKDNYVDGAAYMAIAGECAERL